MEEFIKGELMTESFDVQLVEAVKTSAGCAQY